VSPIPATGLFRSPQAEASTENIEGDCHVEEKEVGLGIGDSESTFVQLDVLDNRDMVAYAFSGVTRCTITVVSDDLASLQPASPFTPMNVALLVSCPALEVGTVCDGTCQPVSFTVSVAGCQADLL
jgi:hypothetical protein